MKRALILISLIMLLGLIGIGFVIATSLAPAPTCSVKGIIQSVTFTEAHNASCLTEENGCPTDTALYFPDRYFLNITINEVKFVKGTTQYSSCEKLFPLNSIGILSIDKSKVNSGDSFVVGQIIQGEISYYSHFDSYTIDASGRPTCGNDVCETGEDIKNICPTCQDSEDCPCRMQCPQDCNESASGGPVCGNGVCETGEADIINDCIGPNCPMYPDVEGTCPQDCKNYSSETECYKKGGYCSYTDIDCDNNYIGYIGMGCEISCCLSNKTLPGEGKVKILPEAASLIARERLGELGFNVTLKEVGQGDSSKSYYEVSGVKEGKMFGLFKVKGKVSVDVDAETGEVLKVHKPWWGFMAGI